MTARRRDHSDVRLPAVAGTFYADDPDELRTTVEGFLAEVVAEPQPACAAIAPHAGLMYSGQCAAHVFKRLAIPPVVVILAPNHTGRLGATGGASAWDRGAFETPLGSIPVADEFLAELEDVCPMVRHDPEAHLSEHAIEVELPFLSILAPGTSIAPVVLAWDDWDRCKVVADALARVVSGRRDKVLLLASSDMTHYESATSAERKDRAALAAVERLDGRELLAVCRRERVTMCGRAPAAIVLDVARQLGAAGAELVDYRHSGWVTGDDSSVVAYAGVVIS